MSGLEYLRIFLWIRSFEANWLDDSTDVVQLICCLGFAEHRHSSGESDGRSAEELSICRDFRGLPSVNAILVNRFRPTMLRMDSWFPAVKWMEAQM